MRHLQPHLPHEQQTALRTVQINLANLLTGFRFVAAPGLLWLAWQGHGIAFMILLAIAFLTDLLDGLAARLTGQVSQFALLWTVGRM